MSEPWFIVVGEPFRPSAPLLGTDRFELRYFGGMSVEETAHVLDISPNTVMRDWNMAKAWLYQELSKG